jgi:hypothetical protein
MKDKLKAHYLKFGPRTFVTIVVLVLIVTDLINSYYMKLYWKSRDMSNKFVQQTARVNSLSLEDFSTETLREMTGFIDNMFMFFLLIVLANNLFFYFYYLRKRLWAQGYVLFYALTAALFSVTFIIDDGGLGAGWLTYNISMIFIYAYIFMGVKVTKLETTLGDGKKGR